MATKTQQLQRIVTEYRGDGQQWSRAAQALDEELATWRSRQLEEKANQPEPADLVVPAPIEAAV